MRDSAPSAGRPHRIRSRRIRASPNACQPLAGFRLKKEGRRAFAPRPSFRRINQVLNSQASSRPSSCPWRPSCQPEAWRPLAPQALPQAAPPVWPQAWPRVAQEACLRARLPAWPLAEPRAFHPASGQAWLPRVRSAWLPGLPAALEASRLEPRPARVLLPARQKRPALWAEFWLPEAEQQPRGQAKAGPAAQASPEAPSAGRPAWRIPGFPTR